MAKAKPIPIAITNCAAHTHTQHNRHCAYATLPTVQLGISTAILPNSNTEIKSNYDKHGQPGSPFTPLLELLQKYVACQVTLLGGGGTGARLLVYYANVASLWLHTSLCVPHIWVLSELSGITTNRAQKILHEFAWAAHKAKQVTSWRADWWTDCANKQKMHSMKRQRGKKERGGGGEHTTALVHSQLS